MRGTDPFLVTDLMSQRFIPACAGNSGATGYSADQSAVHPRVCGEQERKEQYSCRPHGSSPRVRGTALMMVRLSVSSRFIPACAGNSSLSLVGALIRSVHPRVCGEQRLDQIARLAIPGSSPRVRGTAVEHGKNRDHHRFIPACAGNSSHTTPSQSKASVHPRVCGEQLRRFLRLRIHYGSSPRVRGTELARLSMKCSGRFIPACAGNRTMR